MFDEAYAALCDHVAGFARTLLARTDAEPAAPSGRYVLDECSRFVSAHTPGGRVADEGAVTETLDAIAADWQALCAGTVDGESIVERRPGLWKRLMDEWPMGVYADLTAAALTSYRGPFATVCELGAGVGATTRRIRGEVARRGADLIATDLRYGGERALDFDRPLAPQLSRGTVDAVVATNALHCARDPRATLGWIRDLLPPGGVLVLAEGAPAAEPGVPWALNPLFGAFRGWYDRGGFRSPGYWLQALGDAGFDVVSRHPWPSGRYELGGAFVARTASSSAAR